MAIPRAARSFGAWLAIGLLLAITLPAATSATTITGLPPVLSLDEHPFTRNPELQLVVMRAPSQTDTVVERRASNSPTTVDGVLAGDLVPEVGMWTLAPGPDGTRTVYGQLKYASGAWSPVGSVSVELDQSPATSMYADIDQSPVFYDASTGSPAPDWHERSSTPTDPVYGYGISFPSPDPFGFAVADGHWSFSFIRHDGAIEPGSYQTQPLVGDQCVTTCATVSLNAGRDCPGTGTVQIDEIAFTPDGDLGSVAADFRLDCHVYGVMSGSIRYGTDRPMQALDQSAETLSPGFILVGSSSPTQTVTFTNVGDQAMELGAASIGGETPGDYAIVDDSCSGETLTVDESCDIGVRFTPATYGDRFATLSISDETTRGARRVRLIGYGKQAVGLTIAVDPPADGPGQATVTVTVTPAGAGDSNVLLTRDQDSLQPISRVVTTLTGPSRIQIVYTLSLTPGPHHLEAEYQAFAYLLPAGPVSVDVVVPDSGRPWGFMFIGGGPTTATRTVRLTAMLSYGDLGIDKLAISNDGVTWTERVARGLNDADWTLSSGDGVKTVYLRWHEDSTDQWSPIVSDTVILEPAPPTADAPTQRFVAGTTVSSGQVPTMVSWTGHAGSEDLAGYTLDRSIDGGPWTGAGTDIPGTSVAGLVTAGHTYRHRVTAVDVEAHESLPAIGPTTRVAVYSEANGRVSYTGSWSTLKSAVFWGSAARTSTRAGATASITFTGRSIAWVARSGPDRGKAEVYVNGTKVATVDLYSKTYQRQRIAWAGSWSSNTSRKVTIRVVGTKGHPRVDVDAFVTMS